MAYDNTNKGALFRNHDKGEETHPDYKGYVNINGEEYWLSGWINEAGPNARKLKPGEKFLSLKADPKTVRQMSSPVTNNFDDDDIPF